MPPTTKLYHPLDPGYPSLLTQMERPPTFTATGPLPRARAVAIVGSREPFHECAEFAGSLAFDLAKAGFTIVSGGATGIDAAAHRGALKANGATWVVCPTGKDRIAPREHGELFRQIAKSTHGRLVWPFEDDVGPSKDTYLARNGILVQLAEAVVVIQARVNSGSRNACGWAARLQKPLWVVAGPPWGHWEHAFAGSAMILEENPRARLLRSKAQLFESLGLTPPRPRRAPKRPSSSPELKFLSPVRAASPGPDWSAEETAMFTALLPVPQHKETLAEKAGLDIAPASTALLTLSLKDVVVEGPDGFFRRTLAS